MLWSPGLSRDPATPWVRFPIFNCQTANARHRPVFTPAPGLAGHSCSVFPKGRAERLGETPRPRRPRVSAGIPYAKHTGKVRREPDRPQNTGVACVPHANGFFGLLHVPRNRHSRWRVPGSCKLLPGHALGPSARLVGVNCLSVYGSPTSARNPQTFRPDLAAATASSSALW